MNRVYKSISLCQAAFGFFGYSILHLSINHTVKILFRTVSFVDDKSVGYNQVMNWTESSNTVAFSLFYICYHLATNFFRKLIPVCSSESLSISSNNSLFSWFFRNASCNSLTSFRSSGSWGLPPFSNLRRFFSFQLGFFPCYSITPVASTSAWYTVFSF